MRTEDYREALAEAISAARNVGMLLRRHLYRPKQINSETLHDIKLRLDVRSQEIIERQLHPRFPDVAVLGEEGDRRKARATHRWVIDPIDGTVNFAFGIPHACVSIALQAGRTKPSREPFEPRGLNLPTAKPRYETVLGVVYDPFVDELWTAVRGGAARLNGRRIRTSQRGRWSEAIVSLGFAKRRKSLDLTLPLLNRLAHRVRKIRTMGSAALSLVYVASGRMDVYLETGIRLWDIAAGGLILECAGGDFWHEPIAGRHTYRLMAHNGRFRKAIQELL